MNIVQSHWQPLTVTIHLNSLSYILTHFDTHTHTNTHTPPPTHTHTHTTHTRTHTHTDSDTNTDTDTHTHTHTHTHIQRHPFIHGYGTGATSPPESKMAFLCLTLFIGVFLGNQ